ncbi:MAG: 6-phosphogluconolactonase [Oscillospiraceae bacterium]|jgi:glucosamine-6-phosphate deaminase
MLTKKQIYEWCCIPREELINHPKRKVPLRIVKDAQALGEIMARDFADEIKAANGRLFRAIVPCGPKQWYEPFARIINSERISLKNMEVFHMDENLDWEGKLLPEEDPSNFKAFMERYFYGAVDEELRTPVEYRHYLTPDNLKEISKQISQVEIDYTLGGWGQDGHIAFNQANRNPYVRVTVDDIRESTARIQENNFDTILALSQREFGAAWQFQPPMSITLGVKECMKAKKIRVYSATGAWKQTALRVALFADEPTPEYPMTLLQEHPDALITATEETAEHPFSQHPEWKFKGVNL